MMLAALLAILPQDLAEPGSGIHGEEVSGISRPNIILVMADDQGWGDTSFNGHPHLKTPALDQMASEGLRFDRFYAAAAVCSPTRASVLTGRHPYRMKIDGANSGHLPLNEYTVAEMCHELGYTTGHFGKWHLGTLTREVIDSNRGGRPKQAQHYSPPWEHGFDRCFSTEAKVPTWDPMLSPENGKPYGTRYWNEKGEVVTENLEGDDSRIIMDRALPFITTAVDDGRPFLAVIWLHAPHRPVVAGPGREKAYAGTEGEDLRRYYAVVAAIDASLARLREHLKDLNVGDDTLLWYTSDNGPEGSAQEGEGSTAGLRGRKRSLYEGGVRVPGLLVWPRQIRKPRRLSSPASTLDTLPTLAAILGVQLAPERPLDGVSLLPLLIADGPDKRPGQAALPFVSPKAAALHAGRLKAIRPGPGAKWELYDLTNDPLEASDLAVDRPDELAQLVEVFHAWKSGADQSRAD
jgi:arylsulfatase A-like enzyme